MCGYIPTPHDAKRKQENTKIFKELSMIAKINFMDILEQLRKTFLANVLSNDTGINYICSK